MTEPCREACRAEGEPLAGTAGAARALIAIAWPKPLWHADEALLSEGLPGELREVAARAAREGRKLTFRVFQRGPRPGTSAVEAIVWMPQDGHAVRGADLPIDRLAGFVEDALAGRLPASALQPLLLVCTDGKHDRCCATLGRGMLDAIARAADAAGRPFELAESSHLGGHRFAATCLALPSGLVHGRLSPDDAPALVRALAAGRPLAARFRGRFGRDEPEQVAEAWAHARFPGADTLRLERAPGSRDAPHVSVRLRSRGREHALDVRLAAQRFESCTSCGEDAPKPRVRFVVASTVELATS
jgi:hypothetical protein